MVRTPLEQRQTADQGQNKQLEDIDASETLRYLSSPPQIQELPIHRHDYEDTAMAEDKEPFEALTTTEEHTAEQITKQIKKQTQGAMENYFDWLQKTMSALPWSTTNLDRILLSYATQIVNATF